MRAENTKRMERLNKVIERSWRKNAFYQERWRKAGLSPKRLNSMEELSRFPLVERKDFVADQQAHPPFGRIQSVPAEECTYLHRTSGTTHPPLFRLDNRQSWSVLISASIRVLQLAGVVAGESVLTIAPFGPSLGPWTLRESVLSMGCRCYCPGSLSPSQLLHLLRSLRPNVILARPSSLIDLGTAAEDQGLKPKELGLGRLITVCSPGGSELSVRARLKRMFGVSTFDRYGMTEAGPIAGECTAAPGWMHLLEDDFEAEVLCADGTVPKKETTEGELVLTSLRDASAPIIRYRTGDRVRLIRQRRCKCGLQTPLLEGGVTRLPTRVPDPERSEVSVAGHS